MGQCNGCGSVRNDVNSTHTWDLVRALESASPASCKTPATSIDSIRPNNHLAEKKNPEKRSNTQQIVSYCLGLRPRRKNTAENKSFRTAWTHKREPST